MSPQFFSTPTLPRTLHLGRTSLVLVLFLLLIGWVNPVSAASLQPALGLPSPMESGAIKASLAVSAVVTSTTNVTVTATAGISPTATSVLTKTTALTDTIGVKANTRTATIVTNGGYLRSGPGVNNPVVAVGAKGDTYTVIDEDTTGNWLQVCCVAGGREAWIGSAIVKVTATKAPTNTGVLTGTTVLTKTTVLTETGVLTGTSVLTKTDVLTATSALTGTVGVTPGVDGTSPTATITSNRGNLRAGPGTNNPVVAVGAKGDTYTVVSQDESGAWLQVCCVEGARRAWIAASIVKVTGDLADAPVAKALFPADLSAIWAVSYTCDSARCAVPACSGTMNATGRQFVRTTYLEIDRRVEWAEGCGDDSYWLHQVDNYTGAERYTLTPNSPLFRYWIGALPGAATETITLDDGQAVSVICAGPFTQENDEGDGWTSVYTGNTCHDIRTGMIVTMHYDKQWLFTGEFEGETYSREFFGDQESYQLTLTETNVELAGE